MSRLLPPGTTRRQEDAYFAEAARIHARRCGDACKHAFTPDDLAAGIKAVRARARKRAANAKKPCGLRHKGACSWAVCA